MQRTTSSLHSLERNSRAPSRTCVGISARDLPHERCARLGRRQQGVDFRRVRARPGVGRRAWMERPPRAPLPSARRTRRPAHVGQHDVDERGNRQPRRIRVVQDRCSCRSVSLAQRIVANVAPVMDDPAQACGGDVCARGHPAACLGVRIRHYLRRRRRDRNHLVNRVDSRNGRRRLKSFPLSQACDGDLLTLSCEEMESFTAIDYRNRLLKSIPRQCSYESI